MSWTKIEIPLPRFAAEEVSAALMDLGAEGVYERWERVPQFPPLTSHLTMEQIDQATLTMPVTLEAYFKNIDDPLFEKIQTRMRELQPLYNGWKTFQLHKEEIKEEDWLAKWKENFHSLRVSDRIVISPSWEKSNYPKDQVVIYS